MRVRGWVFFPFHNPFLPFIPRGIELWATKNLKKCLKPGDLPGCEGSNRPICYYKPLTSSPPAWDKLEIQTVIANPGNLNYQNTRQLSLPFVSISHVEGIKPRIGPIAPNEDNRRTVHVSQPNTTRQGLWIGPQVFHMTFDKIEVRVNTNRIYHRRLYTLHFLAFRHDRSWLSSPSWGLSLVKSPCKRLLFSSLSILSQQRDETLTSLLFFSLKNIAWQPTCTVWPWESCVRD